MSVRAACRAGSLPRPLLLALPLIAAAPATAQVRPAWGVRVAAVAPFGVEDPGAYGNDASLSGLGASGIVEIGSGEPLVLVGEAGLVHLGLARNACAATWSRQTPRQMPECAPVSSRSDLAVAAVAVQFHPLDRPVVSPYVVVGALAEHVVRHRALGSAPQGNPGIAVANRTGTAVVYGLGLRVSTPRATAVQVELRRASANDTRVRLGPERIGSSRTDLAFTVTW